MAVVVAILIYTAILIFLVYEMYSAWFQSVRYLDKIRKWHEKLPPYLKSIANEKSSLWQVRIVTPIVIIILLCNILAVISFIE